MTAGTPHVPRTDTLRNGLEVTVRELRPDDRGRIAKAVGQLEAHSVYTRLFSLRKELTEAGLDRIMHVDPAHEIALVVTIGAGAAESIIGSGRLIETGTREGQRAAEVAFIVEEDYQGLGVAGRLLADLAALARARGIATLEADVLVENQSMLGVFAKSGLPMRKQQEGGVVHVALALAPAGP